MLLPGLASEAGEAKGQCTAGLEGLCSYSYSTLQIESVTGCTIY